MRAKSIRAPGVICIFERKFSGTCFLQNADSTAKRHSRKEHVKIVTCRPSEASVAPLFLCGASSRSPDHFP